MSEKDTPDSALHALLETPAGARATALAGWLAAQPDADAASRVLARALAAMESTPSPREGVIAGTELTHFLDAERLRFPLDDAAKACSDPALRSELWRHASTSCGGEETGGHGGGEGVAVATRRA
ncbi:MAG: hypothetical protein ABI193_14835 [Minicystis sp.]